MHPNPIFRAEPDTRSLDFAADRGFGALCLSGQGAPLVAHVPFRLDPEAGIAELHLMRSNPVARAALTAPQAALLAVSGPDAYVSPDWYGLADQVPTWNYVAVHLHGRLEVLPDADLRAVLDRLSAHFEGALAPKRPWTSDKMSDGAMERLMRSLLPFRFVVESVEGTWKLGQNKSAEARARAARGIDSAGIGQDPRVMAGLMRGVDPQT